MKTVYKVQAFLNGKSLSILIDNDFASEEQAKIHIEIMAKSVYEQQKEKPYFIINKCYIL